MIKFGVEKQFRNNNHRESLLFKNGQKIIWQEIMLKCNWMRAIKDGANVSRERNLILNGMNPIAKGRSIPAVLYISHAILGVPEITFFYNVFSLIQICFDDM